MDKTNKIKTIEWDKVSCCENCGNKEYYESSEMGISHRRFRLCTKCMNELLSSATPILLNEFLKKQKGEKNG